MAVTKTAGPYLEAISTLGEAAEQAPELTGVPTGVEGLDELFYVTVQQNGCPVRKPLGGIPRYSVLQVTGIADTGKSILVEQFALQQAHAGDPVVFVTLESPAPFVAMGMRLRACAMGIDFEDIEQQILLVDGVTHGVIRSDLQVLLDTLAHTIRTYRSRYVIIDSITGLYESREMLARDIVHPLFNFLKKWPQTALLVSQKRSSHEALTAEAAGGFAIGHILDGSLVLAKQTISSAVQAKIYQAPIGETVRLFRIDGLRLCGHDTRTHLMEITESGLVRIGPALTELAATE